MRTIENGIIPEVIEVEEEVKSSNLLGGAGALTERQFGGVKNGKDQVNRSGGIRNGKAELVCGEGWCTYVPVVIKPREKWQQLSLFR